MQGKTDNLKLSHTAPLLSTERKPTFDRLGEIIKIFSVERKGQFFFVIFLVVKEIEILE